MTRRKIIQLCVIFWFFDVKKLFGSRSTVCICKCVYKWYTYTKVIIKTHAQNLQNMMNNMLMLLLLLYKSCVFCIFICSVDENNIRQKMMLFTFLRAVDLFQSSYIHTYPSFCVSVIFILCYSFCGSLCFLTNYLIF